MNKKQQAKAKKFYKLFEQGKRTNGDLYYFVPAEKESEELRNLIYKAHGDGERLPNDFIYRTIYSALGAVEDYDGNEEGIMDDLDADSYTSELTAWLHDSPYNVYYLTQALEEGLGITDGFRLLARAQYLHLREIYESVYSSLKS